MMLPGPGGGDGAGRGGLPLQKKEKKTYDALEWMAAMGNHVPERGQQSVRYYGVYANSTRGRDRKREA